MNPSSQPQRVYEDFEPTTEWTREAKADTLVFYLPGFAKEELKVQVTSTGMLRVSGERKVSGNKWNRFRKEIPISSNYDPNGITAKFEKGSLYITHPKLIVPALEEPQNQRPQTQVQQPQKPITQQLNAENQKAPKPKEPKLNSPKSVEKTPKEEAKLPPTSQELQNKLPNVATKSEKQPTVFDPIKPETSTKDAPQRQLEAKQPTEATKPEKRPTVSDPIKPETSTKEKQWEEKMKSETDNEKKHGSVEAKEAVRRETDHTTMNNARIKKDGSAGDSLTNTTLLVMRQYVQDYGGWVREMMNKPRVLVNFVLVILALANFAIYARNALRSIRNNKD